MPVYVGLIVDKVETGQIFLRVLRLSPVSVMQPVLHNI